MADFQLSPDALLFLQRLDCSHLQLVRCVLRFQCLACHFTHFHLARVLSHAQKHKQSQFTMSNKNKPTIHLERDQPAFETRIVVFPGHRQRQETSQQHAVSDTTASNESQTKQSSCKRKRCRSTNETDSSKPAKAVSRVRRVTVGDFESELKLKLLGNSSDLCSPVTDVQKPTITSDKTVANSQNSTIHCLGTSRLISECKSVKDVSVSEIKSSCSNQLLRTASLNIVQSLTQTSTCPPYTETKVSNKITRKPTSFVTELEYTASNMSHEMLNSRIMDKPAMFKTSGMYSAKPMQSTDHLKGFQDCIEKPEKKTISIDVEIDHEDMTCDNLDSSLLEWQRTSVARPSEEAKKEQGEFSKMKSVKQTEVCKTKSEDQKLLTCAYCKAVCGSFAEIFKHYDRIHGDGCELRIRKRFERQSTSENQPQCTNQKPHSETNTESNTINQTPKPPDARICDSKQFSIVRKLEELEGDASYEKESVESDTCSLRTPGADSQSSFSVVMGENASIEELLNKSSSCPLCGLQLKSKNYVRHVLLIHYWTRITKIGREAGSFFCDRCAKEFTYKKNLYIHEKSVHQGIRRINNYANRKLLHCSMCSFTARELRRMRAHEQSVHMGLSPYKCHHCTFTTRERTALRDHTFRHFSQKPFVCRHCDHGCIQRTAMKKHLLRAHGILIPSLTSRVTSLEGSGVTATSGTSGLEETTETMNKSTLRSNSTATKCSLNIDFSTNSLEYQDKSQMTKINSPVEKLGGQTVPNVKDMSPKEKRQWCLKEQSKHIKVNDMKGLFSSADCEFFGLPQKIEMTESSNDVKEDIVSLKKGKRLTVIKAKIPPLKSAVAPREGQAATPINKHILAPKPAASNIDKPSCSQSCATKMPNLLRCVFGEQAKISFKERRNYKDGLTAIATTLNSSLCDDESAIDKPRVEASSVSSGLTSKTQSVASLAALEPTLRTSTNSPIISFDLYLPSQIHSVTNENTACGQVTGSNKLLESNRAFTTENGGNSTIRADPSEQDGCMQDPESILCSTFVNFMSQLAGDGEDITWRNPGSEQCSNFMNTVFQTIDQEQFNAQQQQKTVVESDKNMLTTQNTLEKDVEQSERFQDDFERSSVSNEFQSVDFLAGSTHNKALLFQETADLDIETQERPVVNLEYKPEINSSTTFNTKNSGTINQPKDDEQTFVLSTGSRLENMISLQPEPKADTFLMPAFIVQSGHVSTANIVSRNVVLPTTTTNCLGSFSIANEGAGYFSTLPVNTASTVHMISNTGPVFLSDLSGLPLHFIDEIQFNTGVFVHTASQARNQGPLLSNFDPNSQTVCILPGDASGTQHVLNTAPYHEVQVLADTVTGESTKSDVINNDVNRSQF